MLQVNPAMMMQGTLPTTLITVSLLTHVTHQSYTSDHQQNCLFFKLGDTAFFENVNMSFLAS